jgi:tripartite ATP-independent transporter DctP family solute receptor
VITITFSGQIFAESQKIQFGYVTSASETDPYCIASTKFAELIKEKTDGKIELQLFPSGQLGNERDMIEGMQIGTLDAGLITNAPISGFVSSFMVLDLPFIFSGAENAHRTLDGPAGRALLDKLDKIGIKGLAFAEGGFRHMINNVRPVVKVENVKGVKFRVMKNPVYIGLFKYLGSNAIPMPWGEVFTAVQQGVMDGLEIPISVTWSNNYAEVTKYLSLTGHTYSPLVFMVSNGVWNSLSLENQKIFLDSALEAAVYEREKIKEIEADLLGKLEEKGMKINEVPDKKPFQNAVKPLYEEFKDKIGADVLKMVLEEAAKN